MVGTYAILAMWDQPLDVMRSGLVHTGYSGDLFRFYLYDATKEADRAELRELIILRRNPRHLLLRALGLILCC